MKQNKKYKVSIECSTLKSAENIGKLIVDKIPEVHKYTISEVTIPGKLK
jgi:hypothetical protein